MKKIFLLLLIIVWMSIIYFFSNSNGVESTKQSIGFLDTTIGKIIDIFGDNISNENKQIIIEKLDYPIRKIAHMSEYFILAIFVSLYIKCYNVDIKKAILLTLIFCLICACSDEIHQLFINERSGQIVDVFIDCIGTCIWIVIFCIINKKKVKKC